MPRACCGTSDGKPCRFSKHGGRAQPKPGKIRCSWCDPDALQKVSSSEFGRARLAQLLRGMPRASRNEALRRLPVEIYEDYFEDEFGELLAEDNVAELDIGDFLHADTSM